MDEPARDDAKRYERPSVTVDTVLLSLRRGELQVLLVRRKHPPFEGMWAIPGGFVGNDESLDAAARRELAEETGIDDPKLRLQQLHAYGAPDRDPRTRVITVAYLAAVCAEELPVRAGSDAAEAAWHPAHQPPPLAFDHAAILSRAVQQICREVQYSAAIFDLLPRAFTLTELQLAFEQVLGETLDKRNFRRKILSSGVVEATPNLSGGDHRPARLYRCRRASASTLRARRLLP
ncbi:MAG: NUDIX hydrolase [Anaerolineae bacterium]|nr:NUDIX hydrolase [Anaerolineae bacterium]